MIHWAWTIFAFIGGVVAGMFMIAFAEVSRQHDDESKKWWEDNGKEWKDKFPNGNYVLISWSPIITTSALEFICQNF